MKTKSIICGLLTCLMLGVSTSCQDMLTASSDRHSYETATDTLYSYWGVLKTLQNLGERYVILGEARGDLVMPTEYTSDTIAAIADFRNPQDGDCRYLRASDFYAVINNCNAYLASADTLRPIYGANTGKNNKYMMREYAQVWTIRAWVYMQLVQLYDEVPFYTQPLMSTGEVDDFYNAGNCPKANRRNLATLIEAEAGANLQNIIMQDYPQYGEYNNMVHSLFCYFPTQAVLGDLWLMGAQSQADYERAAQYYYDYLTRFWATLPATYYCTASENRFAMGSGRVTYSYGNMSSIYNVSGVSPKSAINSYETITVIPSTTNKLWGTVQRGVNDVFGFTSEVHVSTSASDTTTSASVSLTERGERRQLVSSKAFNTLCHNYPYIDIDAKATTVGQEIRYDTIETAGDARRAWSRDLSYVYDGQEQHGEFVIKQNPGISYSTTYPVIYRKAQIWLRYAEAINRAGFPEHAYAILADGLSRDLTPYYSSDHCDYYSPSYILEEQSGKKHYYLTKAEADLVYDADTLGKQPEDWTYKAAPASYLLPLTLAKMDSIPIDTLQMLLANKIEVNKVATVSGKSQMSIYSGNYIPYNQAVLASKFPYMQFQVSALDVTVSTSINHGIHGRGNTSNISPTWCNTMLKDDGTDSILNPFYNFDLCVRMKWPEFKRVNSFAVSADEYAKYQEKLITAVEDLIIDEAGMELCFEGSRFNDLVRVAERRNAIKAGAGSEWIANKIASRSTGTVDEALKAKVLNRQNWYFKLPNQ